MDAESRLTGYRLIPFFRDSAMRPHCDFIIRFNRENRRYRGGETVSGTVQITPRQDIKSKAIVLTHLWKTEGIGNSHSETLQTIRLAEAQQLTAGQELTFSFEVTAPASPLPCRGKLIAITHAVNVYIEVPWAIDPNFEEDYLLEPGQIPNNLPASRSSQSLHQAALTKVSTVNNLAGKIFGSAILGGILILLMGAAFALPHFSILLLLVAAAAIAWFFIKNRALKGLLGEVTLKVPHALVAPGEPFLAELRFQPPRNVAINSISLTLECEETAVSGSGSDRKQHKHKAFQQQIPLRDGCTLNAGEDVHERILMKFPDLPLWSLEVDCNQIRWFLSARIDILRFPDWTDHVNLQVIHPTFIQQLPVDPELRPHWTNSIPQSSLTPSTEAVPTDTGRSLTHSISTVLAEINALSVHSTARSSVIRKVAGQLFNVSVTISRTSTTLLPGDDDPLYTNGLTVDGIIDGTRQSIRVIALVAETVPITDLPEGQSWTAQVELIEWDSIYNRINARQIPL